MAPCMKGRGRSGVLAEPYITVNLAPEIAR